MLRIGILCVAAALMISGNGPSATHLGGSPKRNGGFGDNVAAERSLQPTNGEERAQEIKINPNTFEARTILHPYESYDDSSDSSDDKRTKYIHRRDDSSDYKRTQNRFKPSDSSDYDNKSLRRSYQKSGVNSWNGAGNMRQHDHKNGDDSWSDNGKTGRHDNKISLDTWADNGNTQ